MSRDDCDVCDEYRAKELAALKTYKEMSEAANRIIEKQLRQIAALEKEVKFWSQIAMKYAPDEAVMEG